jgi:hypothetical protein
MMENWNTGMLANDQGSSLHCIIPSFQRFSIPLPKRKQSRLDIREVTEEIENE